jgi:hypothetical protein
MDEKRDFFISFNSDDKAIADWITFQLKRNGYTVYYQYDDFPVGSDFMDRMNNAMQNSKFTIAIWSNNYFESEFASLESRTALKHGLKKNEIKLIPIKVEDCEIEPLFSTLVYINITEKNEFEAQKLLLSGIKATLSLGKSSDVKDKPKYPIPYKQSQDQKIKKEGFSIQKPLKILYAGSGKSSNLDLELSYQTIAKGINSHILDGTVKFSKSLNMDTSNIFDILLNQKPHIFHFSGKQDGGDIRITDEKNNITSISDVELAGFLASFGDNIKLAIIDTCYSYNCAKSISEMVDFSIGVKSLIHVGDADKFYKTFYNALCTGHSIQDAVGQATSSLIFKKTPIQEIPVLCCKNNIDPSKVYFVDQ